MKWLMKIFLALLLMVPMQSWAASDERGGFRDLYWGESLESVQKIRDIEHLETNSNTNFTYYRVNFNENEPRVLAGVPIYGEGFIIAFWQNQLLGVIVAFSDENSNFWTMKNALTRLYGEPYHDETLPWVTSTVEGMMRSGDMSFDGGAYLWANRTTCYLLVHHVEQTGMFMLLLMPVKQAREYSNEQDLLGW